MKKKVLVVDDNIDILYTVKFILSHHQFMVKTTSKWNNVAAAIRNFTPDLILMDVNLGGADGGDLCRSLKESKKTRSLPIILFSAHKMSAQYVKESKAEGFLSKPFEIDDLVKIVGDNLKVHSN